MLTRVQNDLLKKIVDGTNNNDTTYLPILTPGLDELRARGLVELYVMIKDSSGNFAVIATPEGITFKEPSSMYPIENIAIEKPARKPTREKLYDFDSLEIGQSFFVPGKSAKSMSSAVNNAMKAYVTGQTSKEVKDKKTGEDKTIHRNQYSRKFVAVDAVNDQGVSGARVGRVS
jgi:hypothetical protein